MQSDISNFDEKAHGVGKKISYWLIEIIGNVSSKMTFWEMDLSSLHAVLSELLAHCVKLFTREVYPVIAFCWCLDVWHNVLFCSNSVAVRSMIAQNYSLTQLKLISVLPVWLVFSGFFLLPTPLGLVLFAPFVCYWNTWVSSLIWKCRRNSEGDLLQKLCKYSNKSGSFLGKYTLGIMHSFLVKDNDWNVKKDSFLWHSKRFFREWA